jgi:NADH oxidase (H2O2-forming)
VCRARVTSQGRPRPTSSCRRSRLRLIGGQLHGGEGIKERCDFLAFVAKRGATLEDLAWVENIYSPPIGALYEPIQIAAQNGLAEQAQRREKVTV